jgi:hypothetical protein
VHVRAARGGDGGELEADEPGPDDDRLRALAQARRQVVGIRLHAHPGHALEVAARHRQGAVACRPSAITRWSYGMRAPLASSTVCPRGRWRPPGRGRADVLVGVPLLLPVQEATLVGLPSRYAFDSGGRWYGRPCSSVMSVIDPVKRYCRSDAAVR